MECGGRDVRTVVRYLARDVLKAIDRVNYFEVMLGHVQVTVREVLLIPSRLRFSVRGRVVATTGLTVMVALSQRAWDRVYLCTRR